MYSAAPNPTDNLDNLELFRCPHCHRLSQVARGVFRAYRLAADEMLIALESLAELYKDYLEIDAGEFAAIPMGQRSCFPRNGLFELRPKYPEHNQAYC